MWNAPDTMIMKKRTMKVMLFLNTIHCIDFGNNVGDFILGWQVAVLVPIVEVERQDVLRLLVVRISHAEHRGPYVHSLQLIV